MLYVDLAAEIPSEDVRQKIAALNDRLRPHVCAMAQVAPGSGFRAAALRAVVTSINLLRKTSFPSKVFGDVQSAVGWLAGNLDAPLASTVAEVAAQITSLAAAEDAFGAIAG